ncbi:MAG: crotonase/enoyl-CoA hydratase family protein [Pseudomonadota bacterium]
MSQLQAANLNANERVTIDLGEDGVAQVRLNRPEKMNALDPEMFARIIEAGQTLNQMKGLRAVVLSGEGASFCAGLDVSSFGAAPNPDQAPLAERTYGNANLFQEVAMQWRKLPVPVIAAIHGVCFGGGIQIASGADIRVVHPESRMAIMELKWGLVPDMGGYALWRGLVRDDVLRELIYTNRQFSGAEAKDLGLATYLDDDPVAKATAIATEIANRNPHAIRAAKRLQDAMVDLDTDAILQAESDEQHEIMRTKNQIEAVMAGMQKRAANFDDV